MADQRKTVLITGCNSGIGDALAREFHSRGFRVFATARRAEMLTELRELGVEPLSLELTKPESIAQLKEEVTKLTGGKLDMLINNAGRNYTVPALDIDFDEVQLTFEVNVISAMRMCQAFTPLLIEAKGTIVQIGSVTAIIPYVFSSVYNATKAALHAYTNTLRVELAPLGVKVVTIVTGGVKSNIARTDRELPEGSYYIPLNTEYQRRVKHSQENAMPAKNFARGVARNVIGSRPPRWVWEGNMSYVIWFAYRFLPHRVFDYYMRIVFNLGKLRNAFLKKRS